VSCKRGPAEGQMWTRLSKSARADQTATTSCTRPVEGSNASIGHRRYQRQPGGRHQHRRARDTVADLGRTGRHWRCAGGIAAEVAIVVVGRDHGGLAELHQALQDPTHGGVGQGFLRSPIRHVDRTNGGGPRVGLADVGVGSFTGGSWDDEGAMGPIQRAVRRTLNPISTRVTMLVQGAGTRRAFRLRRREVWPETATYDWLSASAPRPGSRPRSVKATAARAAAGRGEVVVPDVVGMLWDDARTGLHRIGLVPVGPDPDGRPLAELGWPDGLVVDQRPGSGVVVPSGSAVMVWIERGPGSAGVREPRRPRPAPRMASGMVDEETGEAVG
jgi:hypothetical protein